jgi:hypothetical protein
LTAKERNSVIIQYFTNIITKAKTTTEEDYRGLKNYEKAKDILDDLIPHKYDGFRGIVMTAIGGMHIDSAYNPLEDFYACNPRPIFEQGIYYVLEEFNIPTTKSPPLNVAKTVIKLDNNWAMGKKVNTQIAAFSAIKYIKLLLANKANQDIYQLLINFFFFRLEQHANSVRSIVITPVAATTESKIILANKLIQFTLDYPEGGTVPQMVVGKLIRYTVTKENKYVKGEAESVFGTNTTSKKPADIWIEDNQENILNLYEITVKKIDYKRLDDSVHAIIQLPYIGKDINFICRLPIDIEPLALTPYKETIYYKEQWFNFIDISCFIISCITLLTDNEIIEYFSEMQEFINEVNRKEKTKHGWNSIFS